MIEGPAWGIVVAAGSSQRMGGADKIFAQLVGRPLLLWSLRAFKQCDAIDAVVLVVAPDAVARATVLVREWRFTNIAQIVAGGEQRQDSVRAGIDAASDAAIVAIHDGARPLVTPGLITRGVALAREFGAAICAVPSRDTVKQSDAADPPSIQSTLDRATAWLAQTPQCFDRDLLLRAHNAAALANAAAASTATDDAGLVEALGESAHGVRLYEGSYWNMKVTEPEDLIVAETLLRHRLAS